MTEIRPRGRPRSRTVHEAILNSTRELLIEKGYAEISMDRVAERARVGKQSVYRRWQSKAPLVVEAVIDVFTRAGTFHMPDTGDVTADLRAWLNDLSALLAIPENTVMVRALAAAAAHDTHDGEGLFQSLAGPRHDRLVHRLERGVEAGQIRPDVDLQSVADALLGSVVYREILGSPNTLVQSAGFDGLIDALMVGVAPTSAPADKRQIRSVKKGSSPCDTRVNR